MMFRPSSVGYITKEAVSMRYTQGQRVEVVSEVDIQDRVKARTEALVVNDGGGATVAVEFPNGWRGEVLRETIITPADGQARNFFVSVKDGDRTGFLLGPYETLEAAEANKQRGRTLAEGADTHAVFYSYGVSSASKTVAIRTVFGV